MVTTGKTHLINPHLLGDLYLDGYNIVGLSASSLPGIVVTTQIDTDGTLSANSDTKIASQKAAKTYSDTKVASTQIDIDGTLASNSDSKVASQKATKTYADTKQTALGFTAENSANKSTSTSLGTSDTLYPSQNAVKVYADTKQTALGYTAENTANKGAASGYAPLDGSSKVPAANLPTLSSGTIASTAALLKGDSAGNAVAATQTGSGNAVLATSPTLTTPIIGVATATSINKWVLTAPATAATITAGADNLTYSMPEITTLIGFRHIPQNLQSAAYTTVLADSGKEVHHPASDNNARTFTIDSNANVAYPIGTVLLFTNMAVANLTIAITADTMYLAGTGTTGSRIIATYGSMAARKISATSWYAIPIAGTT